MEPSILPLLKKSNSSTSKGKAAFSDKKSSITGVTASGVKPMVGDFLQLDNFGGEVETNDDEKTTLKLLLEDSKRGVVLFTYPKASTPGCRFSPLL